LKLPATSCLHSDNNLLYHSRLQVKVLKDEHAAATKELESKLLTHKVSLASYKAHRHLDISKILVLALRVAPTTGTEHDVD
jgi:hypothetical protein